MSPLQLDADLPEQLIPLMWMVGRWAGAGVVGYPTVPETRFGQELDVSHDGRPFLTCTSRTWALDEEGRQGRPLATETSYWRPGTPEEDGSTPLEVVFAHPTGIVEVYVGRVRGARVELETDLVARTATAKEYSAATRMYGLVEGDLLWVMDMAAVGQPLQSHASARLRRS